MLKINEFSLQREAKRYWSWNLQNPVQSIPSSVAEEGAGSELRSPLFHFGTVAPVYLAVIKYLLKLKSTSGKKMIELGCGTGRFLSYVGYLFPSLEIWGVDYSRGAIEYAKTNYKKFGVHFKHSTAQKTYFPNNSFDFVISSHVIEHLNKEEGKEFFYEAMRLLKKGGYLFLGTPERRKSQDLYMKNPDDEPKKRLIPPHAHEYTLLELKKIAVETFTYKKTTIYQLYNPVFYKIYLSAIRKLKPRAGIINYFTNNSYKLIKDLLPKRIFDFIVRLGLEINLKSNGLNYYDILVNNILKSEDDQKISDNLFLVCQK